MRPLKSTVSRWKNTTRGFRAWCRRNTMIGGTMILALLLMHLASGSTMALYGAIVIALLYGGYLMFGFMHPESQRPRSSFPSKT